MSANEKELIRVEDLHKSFGSLQVLKGVTEHVDQGEVVSVIGPSGGGKSTFLRCLNLLETPTSGKIYFSVPSKYKRITFAQVLKTITNLNQ